MKRWPWRDPKQVPNPKYEATSLHAHPNDMFTICLFISPDLDGYRAPKNRGYSSLGNTSEQFTFTEPSTLGKHDKTLQTLESLMIHRIRNTTDKQPKTLLDTLVFKICFTICLFISPDLDGPSFEPLVGALDSR